MLIHMANCHCLKQAKALVHPRNTFWGVLYDTVCKYEWKIVWVERGVF